MRKTTVKSATSKNADDLRADIIRLREMIRRASLLRKLANDLSDDPEDEVIRKWLTQKQDVPNRATRSGQIDYMVDRILFEHNVRDITDVPDLLSEAGLLVDSDVVLGALQIMQHYRESIDSSYRCTIDYQLLQGYRPHIDIISRLPRCYYQHPGYLAPLEDLLDYLALKYYAGKRAGDAEDGAIGWLVDKAVSKAGSQSIEINIRNLSGSLAHWQTGRLLESLQVWRDKVKPVLDERR